MIFLLELHIAFVVTPTTGSHLHQSHILITQRNYETTNVSTDLATKVTSSGFPGMRSLLPIAKEFVTTYRFNVHARSIHIPCEIISLNTYLKVCSNSEKSLTENVSSPGVYYPPCPAC